MTPQFRLLAFAVCDPPERFIHTRVVFREVAFFLTTLKNARVALYNTVRTPQYTRINAIFRAITLIMMIRKWE